MLETNLKWDQRISFKDMSELWKIKGFNFNVERPITCTVFRCKC